MCIFHEIFPSNRKFPFYFRKVDRERRMKKMERKNPKEIGYTAPQNRREKTRKDTCMKDSSCHKWMLLSQYKYNNILCWYKRALQSERNGRENAFFVSKYKRTCDPQAMWPMEFIFISLNLWITKAFAVWVVIYVNLLCNLKKKKAYSRVFGYWFHR